ncbi:PP2C family protein-serine/threonine phosphatase [Hymenobacter sp.]|jgi:sigma-B regulation protein RsbU (phosphoserine phosphatase)|uniref:PP2C family protein-serine/threonine phosphatase n=1 Tax=Hymenobacter sp. TaxID=1898978 RepID=UPI002EDB4716
MPNAIPITAEKRLFLKDRELGALLEITQAINQDLGEAALYKIFQFTLLGQLNIRRLVLYVKDEGVWHCVVSFGPQLLDYRRIPLPELIIEKCTSAPAAVEDLPLDKSWQLLETVIPVVRNEEVVAYVFIGNMHEDYASGEATKFLETLSNILLGAIENRRLGRQRIAAAAIRKEIEIAQEVQTMLFPRTLPNDDHVAVAASYVPHTAVGGDYYDVVTLDKNRFLFCIADVSGKGVAASLLMSNFQAGLRTLLRQQADLATVANELNNLIFRNAGGDKFITVFFGLYDRTTRRLQYVNAGHNDPLLVSDQDTVIQLKEGTIMLGVMDELPMLQVGEVEVPPRTLLLSYTDGLTEVFNAANDEFGEEGILRVLRQNRFLPLPRLHEELLREIREFNVNDSHFADDITILSCRFK